MSTFEQSAAEMKSVRDRLYAFLQAAPRGERKQARAELHALQVDVVRCLESFAVLAANAKDAPSNLAELVSLTADLRDLYDDIKHWQTVVSMSGVDA